MAEQPVVAQTVGVAEALPVEGDRLLAGRLRLDQEGGGVLYGVGQFGLRVGVQPAEEVDQVEVAVAVRDQVREEHRHIGGVGRLVDVEVVLAGGVGRQGSVGQFRQAVDDRRGALAGQGGDRDEVVGVGGAGPVHGVDHAVTLFERGVQRADARAEAGRGPGAAGARRARR
ncbi:hypothetical protein RGF97_04050 [Streptomyces roseicoloratus]|uniref:Uncharacterized protein n=1 Tax=Streptomyces roseicoloratus TaxID=2508722 RepID=A0ABY9S597_9ACTN|nr:hypothetical protein [Streptomyces roseicoloratus]WMX49138.1 hypothetical protein RGF97_04050 [Streptomyces roseicoloratus]